MATTLSLWTLLLFTLAVIEVTTLPLEPPPGRSGEDQVKETVHKAEEAARQAALRSEKNGNSRAELRVAAIKAKLAAQHALKQRLQKVRKLHSALKPLRKWAHPRRPLHSNLKSFHHEPFMSQIHQRLRRPKHRSAYSNMISLNELASDGTSQNNYREDTTLEDRLALEAEEDKKYGEMSSSDSDLSSPFANEDATQSIQNQVASESARELKEIQQQINAESQNSLGKTTIGRAGATMFPQRTSQRQVQQRPITRNSMLGVQSDLNEAMNNAEGMNADSSIGNPLMNGNMEGNIGSFTGLGQEMNGAGSPGLSPMQPEQQNEQMLDGQASMGGPQETAQSAASALAAGAGAAFSNPQSEMSDIGGLGGPTEGPGQYQQGALSAQDALPTFNGMQSSYPGANAGGSIFGGSPMKKSNINTKRHNS